MLSWQFPRKTLNEIGRIGQSKALRKGLFRGDAANDNRRSRSRQETSSGWLRRIVAEGTGYFVSRSCAETLLNLSAMICEPIFGIGGGTVLRIL
jgi:hypothetical protein